MYLHRYMSASLTLQAQSHASSPARSAPAAVLAMCPRAAAAGPSGCQNGYSAANVTRDRSSLPCRDRMPSAACQGEPQLALPCRRRSKAPKAHTSPTPSTVTVLAWMNREMSSARCGVG